MSFAFFAMVLLESFGARLKRERELRKIPLEEVAQATRIRIQYLRAIEEEHFEKVPGFTFLKGYLRAYSEFVGLNPEEVLLQLEHFIEEKEGIPPPPSLVHKKIFFFLLGLLAIGIGVFLFVKGCHP